MLIPLIQQESRQAFHSTLPPEFSLEAFDVKKHQEVLSFVECSLNQSGVQQRRKDWNKLEYENIIYVKKRETESRP